MNTELKKEYDCSLKQLASSLRYWATCQFSVPKAKDTEAMLLTKRMLRNHILNNIGGESDKSLVTKIRIITHKGKTKERLKNIKKEILKHLAILDELDTNEEIKGDISQLINTNDTKICLLFIKQKLEEI